jgi:integrase
MQKRSVQLGSVVKKGLMWHVRYLEDTPQGRKRKSIPLGKISDFTKTAAKRLAAETLDKMGINSAEHLTQAVNVPTFAVALEKWRAAVLPTYKIAGRITSGYVVNKHIVPQFKDAALEAIDKQTVQVWVNKLNESLKPKSVSNVVKLLRSILGWSDKLIGKLKMPVIPKDQQRWFTPEEYQLIIAGADAFPERRKQYRILFRLAYCTGLRAGELFALRVEDFDFKKGKVTCSRSTYRNVEGTPKTDAGWRVIYLDSKMVEQVKAYLAGRTTGRIFCTRNGTPLKAQDVDTDVLGPLCERLGIARGGMHAFRHGRVSKMDSAGVSDKVIETEIGHSSLRMRLRYTHKTDAERREIAERLAS